MVVHEPIHIKGNDMFKYVATKEGWAGRGTQNDPYIIKNLEIDGEGSSYCISIENVDAYFVIKNCVCKNTTENIPEALGSGIFLHNTQHGILIDNICSENELYGIYLFKSHHNIVCRNECYKNDLRGIILLSSNYNILLNNLLINNIGHDIYLDGSDYNIISENYCTDGSWTGIDLRGSYNNILSKNVCVKHTGIDEAGISLYGSIDNYMSNNISIYNTIGIWIKYEFEKNHILSQNISLYNEKNNLNIYSLPSYVSILSNNITTTPNLVQGDVVKRRLITI